jgi:membrane protein required for colicin V production
MEGLNVFDIVILVVLVIFMIRGVFRGFVKELMGISAIFGGILLAVLFSGAVATLLEPLVGGGLWSQVAAFLLIFLVSYLLFKLFETGLHALIEKVELENLDKALGFFVGLIEGLLISFIIVFLLVIQPFFPTDSIFENSFTYRLYLPLIPYAQSVLLPES